jgi:hypothetical protein
MVPGAPGAPPTREERSDQRPEGARAAENYDPLGVRVGSFKLFPELELDETYNDNIYAATAAQGKVGSFVQIVKPSLDLRSDWNNHMLNLFAKGALGFFSVDSQPNNYQDASVGFDGRVDIQRNWNVYGGSSWNRRHEDRGTPNTVTTTFPVTVYNQLTANVGYYQKPNWLSVRLDGRLDNYTYFDNGLGVAQGVIPNSSRNRTELREAARLGYEFLPGYEVWVRGSLNQRTYLNGTDLTGNNRSSYGWDLVGGVLVDLGGITSIEAFAGYVQQNYYQATFQPVTAPMFGLAAYWNPIRPLWIKPFLRRTVEDSALTTAQSYINTVGGLDVTYNVLPNVRLEGHGDYSVANFQPIGNSLQQYDQYWTFRVQALYLPTRNFFVGPMYQYTNRNSNINGIYDQNIVMLKLGARL